MRTLLGLGMLVAAACPPLSAADWPRFRGPNGSGVGEVAGLPVEFGPQKNVLWKTALPPGHSSPLLATPAIDSNSLYTRTRGVLYRFARRD